MTDMITVAQTFADELTAAAKAVERAKVAGLDAIVAARLAADELRRDGLAKVRRMREEAAATIAASIRAEEAVEAVYRERQAEVDALLADLRGPARIAAMPHASMIA